MKIENLKGFKVSSATEDYIRLYKQGKLYEIAISDEEPKYIPKKER